MFSSHASRRSALFRGEKDNMMNNPVCLRKMLWKSPKSLFDQINRFSAQIILPEFASSNSSMFLTVSCPFHPLQKDIGLKYCY
ncbi:hypothetical protein FGO68_gene10047 [Halteria grandinella]|uniref:Uncharacterized protein n=1 Tax=Halteria grandinella TaxID=5974 RepID=A0A8J8NQC0_HALGN|nr:hypothetical protein FGO68_gene10047 [Halteria grandinella]